MNKLNNIELRQLAPSSIAADSKMKALCTAIDVKLRPIAKQINLVLLLPRLDSLPEAIVDELAWQYHVDFYDYAAPVEKKWALVRQAIAWHKRKGTPAAVEEVCTAVFQSARVFENWEYGGEPYHFQVRLIEEGIPDQSVIDNLQRAIQQTKNTRSWLDGMSFYRKLYHSIYYIGTIQVHTKASIYPAAFKMPDIEGNMRIGGAYRVHRKVVINNA